MPRVGVARGAAGNNCSLLSNSRLLFVKHSTVNEPPFLALQKPFVIFCVKKKGFEQSYVEIPVTATLELMSLSFDHLCYLLMDHNNPRYRPLPWLL